MSYKITVVCDTREEAIAFLQGQAAAGAVGASQAIAAVETSNKSSGRKPRKGSESDPATVVGGVVAGQTTAVVTPAAVAASAAMPSLIATGAPNPLDALTAAIPSVPQSAPAAVTPAAQPQPATTAAAPALADVIAALTLLGQKKGREIVVTVLAQYGADNVTKVPAAKFGECIAEAKKLLAA